MPPPTPRTTVRFWKFMRGYYPDEPSSRRPLSGMLGPVLPEVDDSPPAAPAAGTKSALAFFAVLLALFPFALLAQWASATVGLAATQLFAFLLPAVVATVGSNLEVRGYLRLR